MTQHVDVSKLCAVCGAERDCVLFVLSGGDQDQDPRLLRPVPPCPECGEDRDNTVRWELTPAD